MTKKKKSQALILNGKVSTINKNIRATGGITVGKKRKKARVKKNWSKFQKVYYG